MSNKRKIFLLIFIVCLLSLTMIIAAGCNKNTDTNSSEGDQEEELSGTCTISFYFLPTDTAPTFTRKVDKGTKISATKVPNPTRDGYEFGGWFKKNTFEADSKFNTNSAISADLSLYALWIAPYTIKFYLDDYTDEPDYEHTIKIFSTETLQESKIYTPSKDGYDFDGWYLDKAFTTRYVYAAKVTENLNLYAHWISQFTTLKYETFSGTVKYSAKQVRIGEQEELPIPSRDGCTFEGWYLDEDYNQAITPVNEKYYVTPTSELTVYAKWEINHAHNYGTSATRYLNPTCTESGREAHLCTICGEIDPDTIVVIPALGHEWNEGVWVDAGSYHYIACNRCYEQKDKQPHVWDDGTVIKEATCTEDGEMGHICTLCHATKTSVIEAKGHSYNQSSFVVDEDYHWIECSECHEVMPGTKEKHTKVRDESKDVNSTSCDRESVEGWYCEVCGQDCSKHTPAKDHTVGDAYVYDADHHWKVCTECGKRVQEDGHHLVKDTTRHVDSTCISHGHDIYVCTTIGCNYEYEEELPLADHTFRKTNNGQEWVDWANREGLSEARQALLEDYDFKICEVCGKECEISTHDYYKEKILTIATCSQEGNKEVTCRHCGRKTTIVTPKLPHTHPADENDITVIHAASCTADGEIQYNCTKCHQLITETVAAGHKWEITKEATCTVNGKRTCSVCHAEETIIASHTFNEDYSWDDDKHWHTCSKCGERADEHTHDLQRTVYGTWSCDGTITVMYSCSICGYKSALTEITGPGHDWDEGVLTKPPTCIAYGEITYTCKACGHTRIEYTPMVDHTYDSGSQTRAPTCTVDGVWTYVCTVCGHEKYEAIPALGHDFENEGLITTAPGCTTTGIRTHTCNHGCGETYEEVVAALGHNWDPNEVEVTLEPTCTETGQRTYTCTRCGDHIHEAIPALGHAWDTGTVTIEPGCTTTGTKVHECTRCHDTYDETLPALGHDYTDTVTPPTCTTQGYTTHHCNRCDHEETDTYVAALGHNHVATKVVHPTCKTQGYTIYTCTRCGDTYNADFTPVTSHHYHGYVCIYCGEAKINSYLSTFSGHGNSSDDAITINNEEELILFLDYISANYISTAKYIVFKSSYISASNVNDRWLNNNLWPGVKAKMTTFDRNITTSCTNNIVSVQCGYVASTYHTSYANNLTNYDTDYEPSATIQDYFFATSSTRANDWDAFAYKAYDGTFSCSTSDQLIYALTNCIKPEVVSGSKAAVLLTKAKEVLRQICDDSMSDAEKIAAIYKWIVANVYEDNSTEISITDTTYASNFAESVFGLKYKLKSGSYQGTMYDDCMFATSLGISKAFVLLTGLEGIRSIVVSGTKADAPYYWNKVLVDTNDDGLKEWYALDLISALKTYSTSYKIMSTEQLMVSDSHIGLTATNYADCVASSMYNYYANGEETNLFITTQAQMDTLSAYITANNSKTTTYKTITIFVTDTAFVSGYTLISSQEATISNTYGYIVTIAI